MADPVVFEDATTMLHHGRGLVGVYAHWNRIQEGLAIEITFACVLGYGPPCMPATYVG